MCVWPTGKDYLRSDWGEGVSVCVCVGGKGIFFEEDDAALSRLT